MTLTGAALTLDAKTDSAGRTDTRHRKKKYMAKHVVIVFLLQVL